MKKKKTLRATVDEVTPILRDLRKKASLNAFFK